MVNTIISSTFFILHCLGVVLRVLSRHKVYAFNQGFIWFAYQITHTANSPITTAYINFSSGHTKNIAQLVCKVF